MLSIISIFTGTLSAVVTLAVLFNVVGPTCTPAASLVINKSIETTVL
mgnify:CR=1 FL=1